MTTARFEAQYVICVGTPAEATAAVARALQGQAVVIAVSDAVVLRPLLADDPDPDRPPPPSRNTLREGSLVIDRKLRQVTCDTGRVWTFQDIMAAVWGNAYLGDADVVVSAVKRLRRRLAGVTRDVQVRSVRGVGFRLVVNHGAPGIRTGTGGPTGHGIGLRPDLTIQRRPMVDR